MPNRQLTDSSTRLRVRLREETSAVILEAAETVISQEGLHAARIERIAAHAGVSVGTIYNHFVDRTALVDALFDSRGARMAAMLEKAIASASDRPAREQVRAFLQTMVEHGQQHRALFAALVRENHGPSRIRAPAISQASLAITSSVVVERGVASGEFREDPHRVLVEALTGIARQVLACAVDGLCGPEQVEGLTELFIRGAAR